MLHSDPGRSYLRHGQLLAAEVVGPHTVTYVTERNRSSNGMADSVAYMFGALEHTSQLNFTCLLAPEC